MSEDKEGEPELNIDELEHYWRSLLALKPTGNSMVDAGLLDETRAALRDALHALRDMRRQSLPSPQTEHKGDDPIAQDALNLCRSILKNHGLPTTGPEFDAVICALRQGVSIGGTDSALAESIMRINFSTKKGDVL